MRRFASNPTARPPLFCIGGKLYLDLLYNVGTELRVGFADVQRFLVAVPQEAVRSATIVRKK